MSNEAKKSKVELDVFQEFTERSGLNIIPNSIEKRNPPEPDILCRISDGETVAFELKGIRSEVLEKLVSDSLKSGGQDKLFCRGGEDAEEDKIKEAFEKHYVTEHPIELLFYTYGTSFTFLDNVIVTIQCCCRDSDHDFRRVWFMGRPDEPCKCVFPVAD